MNAQQLTMWTRWISGIITTPSLYVVSKAMILTPVDMVITIGLTVMALATLNWITHQMGSHITAFTPVQIVATKRWLMVIAILIGFGCLPLYLATKFMPGSAQQVALGIAALLQALAVIWIFSGKVILNAHIRMIQQS